MALDQDTIRNVAEPGGRLFLLVRADQVIYEGALVGHRIGSKLAEIADSDNPRSDLIIRGIAKNAVDTTGKSDGDPDYVVGIESGTIGDFDSLGGGDQITADMIGEIVYCYDDGTLSATDQSGDLSPAGRVRFVDANGKVTLHVDECPVDWLLESISDDVASALPPGKRTVTVAFGDLSAGNSNGASVAVNIGATLPANARITGFVIKLTTPFTGGSASAVTVDIGTSGDADAIVDGANVLAAAVDGMASTMPFGIAPFKHFVSAGAQLIATFAPDGSHQLANLTAGACTIDILFTELA